MVVFVSVIYFPERPICMDISVVPRIRKKQINIVMNESPILSRSRALFLSVKFESNVRETSLIITWNHSLHSFSLGLVTIIRNHSIVEYQSSHQTNFPYNSRRENIKLGGFY